MKTNAHEILVEQWRVKIKASAVKKAFDALASNVTNPGMEEELLKMRRRIEEIEKEMLADLSDPAWEGYL